MSSTYAEPLTGLEECLDEIGAVDRVYRTAAEKQELLVGLARARMQHPVASDAQAVSLLSSRRVRPR